jgi:hypothetical protein
VRRRARPRRPRSGHWSGARRSAGPRQADFEDLAPEERAKAGLDVGEEMDEITSSKADLTA